MMLQRSQAQQSSQLTVLILASFALPQAALAMLANPVYVLQGIYVKYYGFSLSAMATVMFFSRLLDAVTDPLIGALSDRIKARTGRRKPLVLIGGIMFAVCAYFLYVPFVEPSILYFTVCLFLFYIGFTLFMIPHVAWGSDIAVSSRDKTSLFSYHTAGGYLGLVLFYGLPLLPIFATTEITPETLQYSVLFGGGLMFVGLCLCMRNVPEGRRSLTASKQDGGRAFSVKMMKNIFFDRCFLIFISVETLLSMGLMIWYSMIFLYVDIYLGLGSLFSLLYLFSFAVGILTSFVLMRAAKRVAKKKLLRLGTLVGLMSVLLTATIQPTDASIISIALVMTGTTVAFIAKAVVGRAMLSEIVDYAELRNGVKFSGAYFSTLIFTDKFLTAVAGAMGLGLVGWLGFDPKAPVQTNDAIFAVDMVMSALPAFFLVPALFLINLIPIDERRHAIIRRRLESREARSAEAG